MRRRLIAAGLCVAAACASIQHPPGGPPRHEPPEVIAISPDSAETNVHQRTITVRFDEVIRDQSVGRDNAFDRLVQISPEVGSLDVSWHRSALAVNTHDPFRPNTAYRITVLPGITDLHSNTTKVAVSSVFSTGPDFPTLGIWGRVWDWQSGQVARATTVLATEHLAPKDSVVYVATTDSTGHFEMGPMPPGTYDVVAFIDQNHKGVLERTDKWAPDTVTLAGDSIPNLKLLIIQRDSAAPLISTAQQIGTDTLSLRVDFNEFLDPTQVFQPTLVRVQRADSSALTVDSVSTLENDAAARQSATRAKRDTTKHDTTGTGSVVPVPEAPVATAAPTGGRASMPKAPNPPPPKSIVLYLSPSTPLVAGSKYTVTAIGFRNLLGTSKPSSHTATIPVPKPPPKPPPR